jgi:signal transduction histidine kinase
MPSERPRAPKGATPKTKAKIPPGDARKKANGAKGKVRSSSAVKASSASSGSRKASPPSRNGHAAAAASAAEGTARVADSSSDEESQRLKDQALALEAANTELRNLTTNLDQIVRQRTRALAESEAQLRRQNVELDRLNRMKSEFISIAAHELRTPMTSIVGYLDLIVEGRLGDLPQDLRRPMTSLRRNAHRLRRLIEDMLDVSRLETGRLAIKRAPCSLAEIVQAVIDEMRPLADDKRQNLSAEIELIPAVDGDSDKLHQVICNLVANSVKYTPEGGQIKLLVDRAPAEPVGDGTSAAPRMARLRVWDNGIGIPPALRSRIFEPFSDVHTAKHHTSVGPDSAGLGLYIARGLVELHAGRIEVASEEGRYSEFSVLLPLAKQPAA